MGILKMEYWNFIRNRSGSSNNAQKKKKLDSPYEPWAKVSKILADVLRFVASITCCLSGVMSGRDFQDEKALSSEGSGRRLGRQRSWGRPCSTQNSVGRKEPGHGECLVWVLRDCQRGLPQQD